MRLPLQKFSETSPHKHFYFNPLLLDLGCVWLCLCIQYGNKGRQCYRGTALSLPCGVSDLGFETRFERIGAQRLVFIPLVLVYTDLLVVLAMV